MLFALDPDWVRLAIFMVVAVGYLISFIATRLRDRQVAKNRLPRPPRKDPDTTKELEDFLKRSSPGRRDTAKKPAQPVSRAQPQADSRTRGPRKADERDKRRRTPTPTASLVNLHESALTKERAASPEATVHPSIDTRQFSERASHLGSFDEARSLENRLKETFSHQVGTLAAAPADSLATQNRAAAAVAAATGTRQTLPISALLSGDNLRSAIILNEILQRPEERW
ncbi:MAG: hypothetical protein WD873_08455 [Candidatus Hydrogenedentales bacterium]